MPGVFSTLASHGRASVRVAAARAAAVLLLQCGNALATCAPIWLDCLLALSQDAWPQVASAAAEALRSVIFRDDTDISPGPATGCVLDRRAFRTNLLRYVDAFGAACKRGAEEDILSSSRLLAGALWLVGPSVTSESLCASPVTRLAMCEHLMSAFRLSGGTLLSTPDIDADTELISAHQDLGTLPRRHSQLAVLTSQEVRFLFMSVMCAAN